MRSREYLRHHKELPVEIALLILTLIIIGGLSLPIWAMIVTLFEALVVLSPLLVAVGVIVGIVKGVHYLVKRRRTG